MYKIVTEATDVSGEKLEWSVCRNSFKAVQSELRRQKKELLADRLMANKAEIRVLENVQNPYQYRCGQWKTIETWYLLSTDKRFTK